MFYRISALHKHISDSNLELSVHVGSKFAVSSSQNDLLWSVQLVETDLFSLWSLSDWLKLRCCCLHFFLVRVLMIISLFDWLDQIV